MYFVCYFICFFKLLPSQTKCQLNLMNLIEEIYDLCSNKSNYNITKQMVVYNCCRLFARNNQQHLYKCVLQKYWFIKDMQKSEQLHRATIFTTDLYQFTCSYSYFLSGKHEQQATFEVFFRKYPFGGKYVILAGIRAVKEFIENLQITQEQEEYLLDIHPHMKKQYFEWLRANLKKKITIKSFKEGDIVFAKEPLITYSGPISIVQLLETPILNLIGFASLVATNASRMAEAVHPKKCVEFGLRRAQGPDGGLSASEYSYIGGFIGTSNVFASQKFGITCYGTMSHAYVTSFENLDEVKDYEMNGVNMIKRIRQIKSQLKFNSHEGELTAFAMFAKSYPNNFVTLIDTYSTLQSGILNTIIVSKALLEAGINKFGIRLDSGDLGAQSIKCRQLWNHHFPKGPRLNILASDDLHEERLIEMQQKGNQIDVFAIGTNIATCKKQPALGLVCKLVELNGQPKMKLSEDGQKATYPANKSTFRVWTKQTKQSCFDLISLDQEQPKGTIKIADPSKKYEISEVQIKKIVLLNDTWDSSPPFNTLDECRQHFTETKSQFKQLFQLKDPKTHPVMMTEKYLQVFKQTEQKNKIVTEKIQK